MTVLGIAAVAYHMLLVHVNIWDSTYHYIAHLTIILVIAALAAIADAAAGWDRGINKLKMVAAVYALITGLATMAYYAVNALELELSQPFITETAMIVTGFALYGEGLGTGSWADTLFGWVIPMLGGSEATHNWHNMIMWVMIMFVIIHIYMAVRADIISRESSVSTIIGGWRMFKDDQP